MTGREGPLVWAAQCPLKHFVTGSYALIAMPVAKPLPFPAAAAY